ncbi:uncharacterized protein LOC141905873 [Tubulanus polymorphus]|uniref:uncharacterized protein LOC141905873 n=1 Tax=Tubulanus polymorphus TaxID=672921 RepID=UPI003DA350A4
MLSKMALVLFFLIGFCGHLASCYRIIMNEDELNGGCTSDCTKMPTLFNVEGCKKIDSCRLSTKGWIRWFNDCDYCNCECTPKATKIDTAETITKISKSEEELYGTCKNSCDKRNLVRTDLFGCDKIKDCKKDENAPGHNSGFVRCDRCVCSCVKTHRALKYQLINVKYQMKKAKVVKNEEAGEIAATYVTNKSGTKQQVTRTLTFEHVSQTSLSTSTETQSGLELSISAGMTIGSPEAGVSASMTNTLTTRISKGFSKEVGRSKSKTVSDSLQATANVPPYSKMKMYMTGRRVKLDIPYTADMKILYAGGHREIKKNVRGVLRSVDVTKFKVEIGKPQKLPKSKKKKGKQ